METKKPIHKEVIRKQERKVTSYAYELVAQEFECKLCKKPFLVQRFTGHPPSYCPECKKRANVLKTQRSRAKKQALQEGEKRKRGRPKKELSGPL